VKVITVSAPRLEMRVAVDSILQGRRLSFKKEVIDVNKESDLKSMR
jgi:hypothetical protein